MKTNINHPLMNMVMLNAQKFFIFKIQIILVRILDLVI